MSQAFLINFVTAELENKQKFKSVLMSQKNHFLGVSSYTELIFGIEIDDQRIDTFPNMKCEAIFLNTSTLKINKRESTTTFNIASEIETVETQFFKDGNQVITVHGDLKFHVTPTNAFPCVKIVGFIGFRFPILSNEIISSSKVL